MSRLSETAARKRIEVKFVHDDEVNRVFETFEIGKVNINARKGTSSRRKIGVSDSVDPNLDDVTEVEDKPATLFENGDVGGQRLFGFETPKRRNALANKVAESLRTPSTPATEKTPIRNRTPSVKVRGTPTASKKPCKENGTPKVSISNGLCDTSQTPYNLRKRFKKKLRRRQESSSDESEANDFSASESEWEGEKSSSSVSSEDESNEIIDKEAPKKAGTVGPSQGKHLKLSYVPVPDEYFNNCSSRKVNTSNHTLGKLRHQLLQDQLLKLLQENQDRSHQPHLKRLAVAACSLFDKWHFVLREGFNILLYGVGSKRTILRHFHSELPEPSIVVNGFFPSLTIQEIVASIADEILGLTASSDMMETIDAIKREFSRTSNLRLYLILHNIDGPMLRNDKSQEILASLASTPNIHLIASLDHINGPLMWDQTMLSLYNFSWWDVTTFEPYTDETAFESSLLIQRSGNLALSSLQNVFRSLTRNAKSIFMLMAEYQKEHKDTANYSGMPFKKLYSACRESLLVSSDLALRSQLTEFLDHQLLKTRRGGDGSELLFIPIDAGVLNQFTSLQEAF